MTPLLGGISGSISLATTTTAIRGGATNSLALLTHGLLFLVLIPLVASVIGFLPRVVIRHTSQREVGQVYVPGVNWGIFVAVVALVVMTRRANDRASRSLARNFAASHSGRPVSNASGWCTNATSRWVWLSS